MLEMKNILKRFPGIVALSDVSLSLKRGEVHALVGENGAGKSTLMKIVAGMMPADGGEILWRGEAVRFRSPAEAARQGIAMVHQESLLAPHLSVAENIFLGREEAGALGWVHRRRMVARAAALIQEHGFPLQAEWRVERLSPAGKQLVEICRAIAQGSSLIIFDEPTSSLSESETREVFQIVRNLRDRGIGVIYITHRLEELRSVGDRVTVLRDGATVHSGLLADLTQQQLIQHMVGRELSAFYSRDPVPPGRELLRVSGLTRAPLLKDISFSLRAGEIVGLGGMIGAGRTELCRVLFGIDRKDRGEVLIDGREVDIRSPQDAVRAGLALVPEDRQRTGLATALPVSFNTTMANLGAVSQFGFLNLDAERNKATEYARKLRIKIDSPKQIAGRLSGGNQQKVAISKWFARDARILLFDEPTRGIDVAAKIEVFELMDQLARSGAAVLMVSSEMPELIQVADRILVMRRGRISGELPKGASQEAIMRLAVLETESGTRQESAG